MVVPRPKDPPKPKFVSDGKGNSDDLLDYIVNDNDIDVPPEYTNFELAVNYHGKVKWTDNIVEEILSLGYDQIASEIPGLNHIHNAISFVKDLISIFVLDEFPEGYYHTYTVSIAWDDVYSWDGGTTYTSYSYECTVVWNTIAKEEDFWQLQNFVNNTKSSVKYP